MLSQDLVARFGAARIPRYTSYPTAPHFRLPLGDTEVRRLFAAVDTARPVSLYVHIPFCASLCWYCGCHMRVVRSDAAIDAYARALDAEIAMVAAALPGRARISHLHIGGGTPTHIGPARFRRLMASLGTVFDLAPSAELAVEVDPRTLDADMIAALAASGINRASLGVQSFDARVQHAVNRVQSPAATADALAGLRAAGIARINADLMYGLPHQDVASCVATAAGVAALRPDRFAVFGYAHVPEMKPHQRLIDDAALPGAAERLRQVQAIAGVLAAEGYRPIGLDHFALADDPLALAQVRGTLRRNFQGYTTDPARVLVGLGASAIGAFDHAYVQNATDINDWRRSVEAGHFATRRGVRLGPEDHVRRAMIERIMCDLGVDVASVAAVHGFDAAHFAPELDAIARDGLARVEGTRVTLPEALRPFVRSVAAAFDAYLVPASAPHARAL